VIEKAGVDAEVAKLSTLFSVWRNQRYANESEVGRLPMMIEALEKKVALYTRGRGPDRAADAAGHVPWNWRGAGSSAPMRWARRYAAW
jgi:hypothetical protein